MKFRTEEGEIDLPQESIAELKTKLRGPLLTASDSGYEDSRTVWNGMIDRKPSVVVR